jgi:peptidoglycan/xylan/chitin deacetylase (PgdA/CDA1 family)
LNTKHLAALIACITLSTISQSARAGGEMALTFDDLPAHGPVPHGISRTLLMQQIVDALERAKVPPTYGFINSTALETGVDSLDALQVWRSAGWPLANHTYSHMDLHANPFEAFRADVIANEAALERLMEDEDWRWFRYPYLREGDTEEKRNAVRELLRERGYRIAQVTIDFQDWAYNEPYVRCLEKRDAESISELQQSYLQRAAQNIDASEQAARRLYGRNIKHVMLLHVGALQPTVLPQLLSLIEQRGYEIVALEAAQSDPAYSIDPGVPLPYGTNLLTQMAFAVQQPGVPYVQAEVDSIQQMCR